MSRQFILLAHVISVGALGNRVIEDKNPHDESEFENVDELVRKGFLAEVKTPELDKAELDKAELDKAELAKNIESKRK